LWRRSRDVDASGDPAVAPAGPIYRNRSFDPGQVGWPLSGFGSVGRGDAMRVPTLAYIRGQLAGGVASMPLERYRTNTDTGDVKLDPGWCSNPDPAPTVPTSVFWSWVIDDLFFAGKSTLIVLGRDSTGFPVMFRRVQPGQLTYDPAMLAWGTQWQNTELYYMGLRVPPADVVVIDGPHEGVCNYGAATIQAALDLENAAGTAASEPLPNIDLHQTGGEPMATPEAQALVDAWRTARRAGATAYTPQNLDARVLGWSSAELQMIEARQYMATQLARMAGVNPTLVSAAMGSSSSYVYTNQADYRAAFLDDCLDSYLRAIEGRLSAGDVTPRGQYVQFDRDAFTRLTLLQRVDVMVGALKSGAPPALVNQLATALDLDITMPGEPDPTALPTDQPAPPPPAAIPAPAPTAVPAAP
jgi:phage portal protein BeeE